MVSAPHRPARTGRHRAQGGEPTKSASTGYRPELHGLRGLAIALVVLYHVFFDRVSGGVDVFLFISAFFLTGSFVRRMEDGRPMAPLGPARLRHAPEAHQLTRAQACGAASSPAARNPIARTASTAARERVTASWSGPWWRWASLSSSSTW